MLKVNSASHFSTTPAAVTGACPLPVALQAVNGFSRFLTGKSPITFRLCRSP